MGDDTSRARPRMTRDGILDAIRAERDRQAALWAAPHDHGQGDCSSADVPLFWHVIWKEPLAVRNRTMVKDLTHKTIVDDASYAGLAGADWLLIFRKKGANPVPVAHPRGFTAYHGASCPPADVLRYRGHEGSQLENRYSQWVWRQYAGSVWDDIRGNLGQFDNRNHMAVLPYREARDEEDEKHVHPLQLDVSRRLVDMRTNPGETVLTPFMGVGSEVYAAVELGRKGVGIELKPSYYRQAVKNLAILESEQPEQMAMEF